MSGGSKRQTVGYKYYVGIHFILCRGPVDAITRWRIDDKRVFGGYFEGGRIYVDKPYFFGGESREGGISGAINFDFGGPDQEPNTYLQSKLGSDIPAFRTVVSAIVRRMYIGNNPYLKKWDFRVSRIFTRQDGVDQWYSEKAAIPAFGSETETWEIDLDARPYPIGNAVDDVTDLSEIQLKGVTLSGVAATDIIKIELPKSGRTWIAWSPWGIEEYSRKSTGSVNRFIYIKNSDVSTRTTVLDENPDNPYGVWNNFLEARDNFTPRNLSGATSYTFFLSGPPNYDNSGGLSILATKYGHLDMNPAHIIREAITDPDWGMGYPESDVDDVSFMAAADTLFDEGFGLSLTWDRKKEIQEFIEDILRHINAALYVSPRTGKFVLTLIRADYALSELTRLDEDSVIQVDDYEQVSFGELINSINVVYSNYKTAKDDSVTAQDIALIQQQGGIIETTQQYPGIRNDSLAAIVAERDLQVFSSQLLSCTVYSDRTGSNLNVGDPFILDWPELGISSVVMRVLSISYGNGTSNQIKISATQDVFDSPTFATVSGQPAIDEDDDSAKACPVHLMSEIPYFALVKELGESTANDTLENNPFAGYAFSVGVKPNDQHVSADLIYDDGAGYTSVGVLQFCPAGELLSPLNATSEVFYVSNVSDLDIVEAGGWAQCGSELIRIDSIELDSTGNYLLTVGRGILDTTPRPHEIDSGGKYVLFWDIYNGSSSTEYSSGETVLGKILTETGADTLSEASAPEDSVTFRERANLPYPPGDLRIQGESYPDFVEPDSADLISIDWTHRDRTQQTGSILYDHTESNIGPEAGVTYTVRLLDEFDIVRSETTGISGTNTNVDLSILLSGIAAIEVTAVRDGLESWMPARHRFEYAYIDSALVDSAGSYIDPALVDSAGSYIDSAEFSPTQFFADGENGGLYDPSNLGSLWQDTSKTIPVTSDGDPVAVMEDLSGNGNDLTQATSLYRPTYRTSGGLHWLEFNGTDDHLVSGSLSSPVLDNSNGGAFLGVAIDPDTAEKTQYVFEESYDATRFVIMAADTRTSPNRFIFYRPEGNVGTNIIDYDSELADSPLVGIMSNDGTTVRGYKDGVQVSGTAEGNRAFAGSTSFWVGQYSQTVTANLNGKIYGAIAVDRELDTAERSAAHDWLAIRAGL